MLFRGILMLALLRVATNTDTVRVCVPRALVDTWETHGRHMDTEKDFDAVNRGHGTQAAKGQAPAGLKKSQRGPYSISKPNESRYSGAEWRVHQADEVQLKLFLFNLIGEIACAWSLRVCRARRIHLKSSPDERSLRLLHIEFSTS